MGHRNHRLQASQAREDASGVPVWGPGGPVPPACTAWAWDQNREGLPLSQPRPLTLHHPRLVGWSSKRFLSEQKSYVTAAAGVGRDRAGLSLPQPSAQLPGSHSLPPSPCCRLCPKQAVTFMALCLCPRRSLCSECLSTCLLVHMTNCLPSLSPFLCGFHDLLPLTPNWLYSPSVYQVPHQTLSHT